MCGVIQKLLAQKQKLEHISFCVEMIRVRHKYVPDKQSENEELRPSYIRIST